MGPTVGRGDAYFLEVGADDFLRNYPNQDEGYFLQTGELLLALYDLVKQAVAVRWEFPQEAKAKIGEFQKLN
jgi:hypothetical protein